MPLHHAVPALLAVKPAHGYELKTEVVDAAERTLIPVSEPGATAAPRTGRRC